MRRAQTAIAMDYLVSIGISDVLIKPLTRKTIRLIGVGLRSEFDLLQERGATCNTITVARTQVCEAIATALKEMKRDNDTSRYILGGKLCSTHVSTTAGKIVLSALENILYRDGDE